MKRITAFIMALLLFSGCFSFSGIEARAEGVEETYTSEVNESYGENIIVNGNFDTDDFSSWDVEQGEAVFKTAVNDIPIVNDVTTYAVITDRTKPSDCFAQDITAVVENGHTYEYEFFAMLSDDYEGAPANQRQVDFAPYIVSDGNVMYLGSYSPELTGSCSQQLTPGKWTRFFGTFKVASAGNLDKVVIRLLEQGTDYGSGICVLGEYYVTGVSLRDMNLEAASIEENVPNLKDTLEKDFGKDVVAGVSIVGSEISDKALMSLVTKHFNSVTLGNELKPDALFGYSNGTCPKTTTDTLNGEIIEVPVLDYSRAEYILDYIVDWNENNSENQIKVRGHVLVWHSQTPEWFFHEDYDKTKDYATPEEMNKRLEWYIKTVLTHFTGEDSKYKDLFYGWDVVNEAVSDSRGTYRSDTEGGSDSLTDDIHSSKSSWWRVYQSNEFIINAFRYANMYAPADVELYYNDYNDAIPSKVAPITELLKAVKSAEGTRIDGMGMQGHYHMDSPTMEQFETAVRAYAAIVGKVQLTELDIRASSQFDGSDEALRTEYNKQAYRYNEIYESLKKLQSEGIDVGGMTVWGVIDGNSWLQSNASVGGGADGKQKQCPLLFDDDYKIKPAFWGIVDPSKLEPLTQKDEVDSSVLGTEKLVDEIQTTENVAMDKENQKSHFAILSNLIFSLNATMPIFFMMVLGFWLKKIGFLDENTTTKLNQLVFRIFLPALLFMDLAKEDFVTIWDTKMVVFCFVVTVLSIGIASFLSLLSKNKAERGEIIQAAYRSGAATLGIVFMTNIYDNASMVALMIIGSVPLYNVAAVIILYLTSPQNQHHSKKELWKKTAKNVVTNPIIIGIILGMLWSVLNIPQPVMVEKSITYLGNMASPLALIALGASFEFYNVKEKYKETIGITGIKLFLFCIIFLPLAVMMGFRNEKLVAILVMLGSATTSSCFIMAKNMGHEGKISSCSVMVTTLLSSFSLTMWLFILKTLQYI